MKTHVSLIKFLSLTGLVGALSCAYGTCYLPQLVLLAAPGDGVSTGVASCLSTDLTTFSSNVSMSCTQERAYNWDVYIVTRGGYAAANVTYAGQTTGAGYIAYPETQAGNDNGFIVRFLDPCRLFTVDRTTSSDSNQAPDALHVLWITGARDAFPSGTHCD